VKYGALNARGKYVLFLDADGATDIKELSKFFKIINEK
jgi:glycosyltransferase involved in cell wall biosynthesis